jgi:hypothetical protein
MEEDRHEQSEQLFNCACFFFISVIAGALIVTTVFFSFRRINHNRLNHLQ